MKLNNLHLENFRNYGELFAAFDKGVNLIVGDNAQGKTNLLEAIAFLGSGRAFRTQKTAELVHFGAEFAQIEGSVFSQEREQSLRWVLFSGQRPRQLYRNGVKKKTAGEIAGVMQTVLFCPEDLTVLKGGASGRRRLADAALCQLRPNYEAALTEYSRILEQKSRILKDRYENTALLEILPEYNARLCQVGALLISYRARFFEGLGREASVYHGHFSGGKEEFSLVYRTVSTVEDPFAPVSQLEDNLKAHLESHYRAELESGQCLTGPHKDDFDVFLSDLPVKAFGSQGQTRTATISLKLAQRQLMKKEAGQTPILLLDDVLSELDPARQDFVLNQITDGQVFITCCEPGRFTELGTTIEIKQGNIIKN
ncbi:MAG: DNA replication/repair protein RecF [Ruminococcaceae bacterium]|nr:DNA replication/repair protein RecF [Oscillospiraceae bacterium]